MGRARKRPRVLTFGQPGELTCDIQSLLRVPLFLKIVQVAFLAVCVLDRELLLGQLSHLHILTQPPTEKERERERERDMHRAERDRALTFAFSSLMALLSASSFFCCSVSWLLSLLSSLSLLAIVDFFSNRSFLMSLRTSSSDLL